MELDDALWFPAEKPRVPCEECVADLLQTVPVLPGPQWSGRDGRGTIQRRPSCELRGAAPEVTHQLKEASVTHRRRSVYVIIWKT